MLKLKNHGLLGSGAGGSVYLMTSEAGQRYAVKQIQVGRHVELIRELEALHALKGCSNVVPFIGFTIIGEFAYLTFKYYKRNLIQLCMKSGNRSWSKHVLFQIIQGVSQCHAKGVIHLDLKPANIMVNDNSLETRIIDFGLSRIATERLAWTRPVVTEGFRAPELLRHESYDEKVDMFCVGVIIAQVYGNLKPLLSTCVRDDNVQLSHLEHVLWAASKNYAALFPNVPVGALSLLRALLSKDPATRPSALVALDHEWFKD